MQFAIFFILSRLRGDIFPRPAHHPSAQRVANAAAKAAHSVAHKVTHKARYDVHDTHHTPSDFNAQDEPHNALNGRVLVLNQSYEPISVCNVQKAMILLFLTKAELVAGNDARSIRSVSRSFVFPSVIRLCRYVHTPAKKIELSRKNVLRRDANRCQYCGTTKPPLTVDHIMPKSRGGQDTWENLTCACVRCNVRKGNRTPDEAGIKLLRTPRRPSHVTFIKNIGGDLDERWKPYLFI
jgi:5-methylcytosine-specific restriction endonuclease McrA